MILKKVSLLGFKSFSDKIELLFGQGITSIVGPNGCGKSNVVDAIRWVLGEQRVKTLRGGKMEDIIFNGCDSRKASNFAEVSITFDNTQSLLPIDFHEVTVTRRLFRDGQSQYLINKTQCRMKDIQELFMDTGIGTDSYSIIEQGEMDRIINAKPVERREIFEEAAGITKYKLKRKEAQRKLEFAMENLARLRDILTELDSRMTTLSRQADKARRYKNLTQELKLLESQYSLRRFKSFKEQMENDAGDLFRVDSETTALRTRLEIQENTHCEDRDRLSSLEVNYQEVRDRKFSLETETLREKQTNQHRHERIQDLQKNLEDETLDQETERRRVEELLAGIERLIAEKQSLDQDLLKKQGDVEINQTELSKLLQMIEEKKRSLVEHKNRLEKLNKESQELQNQLVANQTDEKNLLSQIEKHSDEVNELNLSLEMEEEQVDRFRKTLENVKAQKELLSQELLSKENSLKQKQQAFSVMESEMIELSLKLNEKNSRKEALENLKNSYEGFFNGVRAIMMKKKTDNYKAAGADFPGVIGVVSDVMKVHPDYEVACEVALGARIQNIVVETGEDAKQAIDFLKQHQLGRATFLPLDLMRSLEASHRIPEDSRILGRLLDFVTSEERYSPLMQSLLGNYLVVRDLSDATILIREGLMREGKNQWNWVTVKGEWIAKSGAITGGETKAAVKGILSRENEIDELVIHVKDFQKRLIAKNEQRNALKQDMESLTQEREQSRVRVQSLSNEVHDAERDFQRAHFQKETFARRRDLLLTEMDKSMKQRGDLSGFRETLFQKLSEFASQDQQIKTAMLDLEKEGEIFLRHLTENREKMAAERTQLENWNEKKSVLEVRHGELQRDLTEREQCLLDFKNNQNNKEEALRVLTAEIEISRQKILGLSTEEENVRQSLQSSEEEILLLKTRLQDFDQMRKNIQISLDGLQERNTLLKVRIKEFEGKIENLKEHLYSKYQLRLEVLEEDTEAVVLSWDEVPERLEQLETRIRNLGSVNLEAIEELETLQKRNDFLKMQETDMNNAHAQLQDLIQRLNVSATLMFNETFEKVRVYFNDLFVELFGGGKAELTLLESADVLDAGIDIVAHPTGKKPQTISLLSGGEKALTAVALLFALFKVKPSPFCVIDELDAPLDEANIHRFTKLVQHFSQTTQFIIITHNKNTIKVADLLYGVTQEVKGVSRLISMKFVEEDLEELLKDSETQTSLPILPNMGSRRNNKAAGARVQIREDEMLAELRLPEIRTVELNPTPEMLVAVSLGSSKTKPQALNRLPKATDVDSKTEEETQEVSQQIEDFTNLVVT